VKMWGRKLSAPEFQSVVGKFKVGDLARVNPGAAVLGVPLGRRFSEFAGSAIKLVVWRQTQKSFVFGFLDFYLGTYVDQLEHQVVVREDSTGLNWQPSTK
jgi:hypothetical protein